MKFVKLTALFLSFVIAFAACDKELKNNEKSYGKTGVPVTAGQSVPSLPTTGSGTVDLEYTPVNKTLNYKLTWTNLTDSVLAIRINGPASAGTNAVNLAFTGANPMNATTTPYVVVQEFVGSTSALPTKSLYGKTGSFTGSLLIDGVKVRDDLLMEGLYYFTIHTKTIIPSAPAPSNLAYRWFGEIRAQIVVR